VHAALLETAIGCRRLLAAGREVRWLHAHAAEDPRARKALGEIDASFFVKVPMPLHIPSCVRALTRRGVENRIGTPPDPGRGGPGGQSVEITPEILKLSKELTSGLTNQACEHWYSLPT